MVARRSLRRKNRRVVEWRRRAHPSGRGLMAAPLKPASNGRRQKIRSRPERRRSRGPCAAAPVATAPATAIRPKKAAASAGYARTSGRNRSARGPRGRWACSIERIDGHGVDPPRACLGGERRGAGGNVQYAVVAQRGKSEGEESGIFRERTAEEGDRWQIESGGNGPGADGRERGHGRNGGEKWEK